MRLVQVGRDAHLMQCPGIGAFFKDDGGYAECHISIFINIIVILQSVKVFSAT